MTPGNGKRRTALITGASGGIGAAIARRQAAAGYELLLTARRAEPLKELAAELGGRFVPADTADEADVAGLLDGVDHMDLLVHAAGVSTPRPFRELTAEEFDETLRVNLRSAFVITKAVLPLMTAGARIIFIGSVAGERGLPTFSAYSASKGGLRSFAEALEIELRPDGIQVHTLSPAPVDTAMIKDPNLRLLDPEDVADAVAFLDNLEPWVAVSSLVLRGGRKRAD